MAAAACHMVCIQAQLLHILAQHRLACLLHHGVVRLASLQLAAWTASAVHLLRPMPSTLLRQQPHLALLQALAGMQPPAAAAVRHS